MTKGHKMQLQLPVYLLTIALFASLLVEQSDAKLKGRLLERRQSGESEQEATTATSQSNNNQGQQQAASTQQPPRLYPDLPRQPNFSSNQPFSPQYYPPNHGPTPFVPFGLQIPTGIGMMNDPNRMRLPPQPRPMTSSERLQSQTFVDGLGKRLLSMIGIESNNKTSEGSEVPVARNGADMETMKALQNTTVLQQLNRGVHSIYGSLSKMYNDTVQQQLNLLQERFNKESENSTNPWQQRMAQQVPQFFKSMASRVEEAQARVNQLWQQVSQAKNGSLEMDMPQRATSRSSLNSFDPFGNPVQENPFQMNNFFDNIGRTFGFGNNADPTMNPNARLDPNQAPRSSNDIGSQLRQYWNQQVQPQIGMVRGEISRVWRDLTSSGMFTMQPIFRSGDGSSRANSSGDLVEDILSSVDINSPEYTLVEPKTDQRQGEGQQQMNQQGRQQNVGSQMQNGLIGMQREINQLWMGLSKSIQGTLSNLKNGMNQRQPPMMSAADSSLVNKEVDPAENEISGKIQDLSKLQREADTVHDIVKQKQQEQQRVPFVDRFRNFLNNVDFSNMEQLPNRVGESVSRFGGVVGDLWNQIPERWDNFLQNRRPQDSANAQMARVMESSSTTQAPETIRSTQ